MYAIRSYYAMRQINATRKTGKDDVGNVDFRTASSKQDASTKWVHPGKKLDMTLTLMDINARMGLAIDDAIQEIMDKHRSDWV